MKKRSGQSKAQNGINRYRAFKFFIPDLIAKLKTSETKGSARGS